jgi:hypothetical protein
MGSFGDQFKFCLEFHQKTNSAVGRQSFDLKSLETQVRNDAPHDIFFKKVLIIDKDQMVR